MQYSYSIQVEGKFIRPEAEVLDRLRLAFFEDLAVPVEEERGVVVEQLGLL